MISTSVTTSGMPAAILRLNTHRKLMSYTNMLAASTAGAEKAKELIVAEMALPKSGRRWWNLQNRSSAKGEMPAIQSGELVVKMNVRPAAGRGKAELVAEGKHALWMEFGFTTRDGGFHIRPFMRPGIAKYINEIRIAIYSRMRALKAGLP